jgi:hypothetical protein
MTALEDASPEPLVWSRYYIVRAGLAEDLA